MTAVAHTSVLPNPSTGEMRLFDVARWLVTLLVVHFIIARASRLAAALHKPYGPDDAFLAHFFGTTDRDRIFARMTRALHRAAALEDELRARHLLEQGFHRNPQRLRRTDHRHLPCPRHHSRHARGARKPRTTHRRGGFKTRP